MDEDLTQDEGRSGPRIDSVFVHIPKAAGTSVKNVLHRVYGRQNCLRVWHGGDISVEELKAPAPVPPHIRNVMGHFAVNAIRANHAVAQSFARHGRFTLAAVRDPLDRLLSAYRYILATPGHPRREDVLASGAEGYLLGEPADIQCRWLDIERIGGDDEPIRFRTPDAFTDRLVLLDSARLDRALPHAMSVFFGKVAEVPRLNVNPAPDGVEIAEETRAELRRRHATDCALYDRVRRSPTGVHGAGRLAEALRVD